MEKITWKLEITRNGGPLFVTAVPMGIAKAFNSKILLSWRGIKVDIYLRKREKAEQKKAVEFLRKEIVKIPNLRKKFIEKGIQLCEEIIKKTKLLSKRNLSHISNRQLFNAFQDIYKDLVNKGTTIVVPLYFAKQMNFKNPSNFFGKNSILLLADSELSSFAEPEIKNLLKKKISGNSKKINKYFNILLTPEKLSLVAEEELSFLKLIDKCKRKKLLKKERRNLLKTHLENWAWISTDFAVGKYLTINGLEKRMNNLLKTDYKQRIQELGEMEKEIEKEKEKIIKELNISKEDQKIIGFLSYNCFFRLYQRYNAAQLLYYGKKLWEEISKRLKLNSTDDLFFCTYEEIKDCLTERKVLNKKLIKDRQKKNFNFVAVCNPNKVDYYSGKEAIKFLNSQSFEKVETNIEKLKGTVACMGKVKGTVRIVLELSDMKKVQKGDILVSNETTPDLLPAMERAAAFVTDEGGLSCHAAIVSREMKKPCIVGTKIATKFLKDGDLIEVDANKGVVKEIKS